jgi:concentrative nucleoside transporter, CNT family
MANRTSLLRRILPLWIAAGLLLTAGWIASAQETPTPFPADTPAAAPAEPLPEVEARVFEDPAPGAAAAAAPTPGEMARTARAGARGTPLERAISFLGLLVFVAVAWLLSVNRVAVRWRIVFWGLGLQLFFAVLILRTEAGEWVFDQLNRLFVNLLGYTRDGARFIFGNLVDHTVPVTVEGVAAAPALTAVAQTGAYFAFSVLPTIIFFASLMTLLYYIGIMQLVVKAFAWVMVRTMGTSGSESLSAAGNIFVGQTEAPLLVKPFVRTMTQSELHAVMTGGFATVAGGVMAAYVGMLVAFFPDIAGHLLAASVMSAPAALAISKVMYPETEESVTRGEVRVEMEKVDANAIDAAARGASEGLGLALNVGAMLLAFLALLALLNGIVGGVAGWFGQELSIQMILGWVGAPVAWLMGVSWQDAQQVGMLLGEKMVLNEFVAYLHLASLLSEGVELSARSVVIATYALAGFANFSSIAIQIGGIGGLAPERRGDLSRLGLRAMIGGTLAAFMTACVVGILI